MNLLILIILLNRKDLITMEQTWNSKCFRRNIRIEMRKKGWKQKDLADAVGITKTSISRYMTGDRIPNAYILSNIAQALECSVNDLITYS